MCWACYTSFSDTESDLGRKKKRLGMNIHREPKHLFRFAIIWGSLVSFMSSGYFPDYSFALFGTGAGCVVAVIIWDVWEKRKASRLGVTEGNEEPVQRILDTILLYGVRDGASQIRLRAGIGVQVHYFINGEWYEQMKLPAYVWGALRSLIIEKTDNWQKSILFGMMPDRVPSECWSEFKNDPEYPVETILLTLRPAPPIPRATA